MLFAEPDGTDDELGRGRVLLEQVREDPARLAVRAPGSPPEASPPDRSDDSIRRACTSARPRPAGSGIGFEMDDRFPVDQRLGGRRASSTAFFKRIDDVDPPALDRGVEVPAWISANSQRSRYVSLFGRSTAPHEGPAGRRPSAFGEEHLDASIREAIRGLGEGLVELPDGILPITSLEVELAEAMCIPSLP